MNLIKELNWRGLIHDIMPKTEEFLSSNKVNGYIGFDPTANSLHIGSLVPIILLVHLQKAGHQPIALVGGATGMVGDPSGKSAERNLLDEKTLLENVEGIKKQLSKFLDFESNASNKAKLVNNYDWFKNFNFLNFIRDVGKHITVNYMMSKDSVKKRLESENGMSFTEFSYQLVQGYDFLELFKTENCVLQMGGSDQWGNILTGAELIHKKLGAEVYAFTCPLITKADGGKFGKTEKGNVWLDAEKTSPYEFYQFWIRSEIKDAEKWIKIFTFLTEEEINSLIIKNNEKPEDRILQKKLAEELTIFVHGKNELEKAIATSEKLFNSTELKIEEFSINDLNNLEGIIKVEMAKNILNDGIDIIQLLTDSEILQSKSEARKMIDNNGISINRKKVDDSKFVITTQNLLHNQYILVQKGKKNYYLIQFL